MALFGFGLVLGTALGATLGAVECTGEGGGGGSSEGWWGHWYKRGAPINHTNEQRLSITMKNRIGSSGGINPERVGKKAIAIPVNDLR